jgi:hypothetical protein
MNPLEVLLLTILGGFSALFLFLSKDYNPTAALFPQAIAVATLIFLALLVIRIIWGRRPSSPVPKLGTGQIMIFAVQGVYVLLIYALGFFAATLLFLFIAPVQLRYKRWGIVVANSVLLTAALTGSFLWLFNIQLPGGAIWDLW